jgi:tRNA U34 5-methylaminomethyl-2-thiouridine-forming methyltransferase MnmC
MFLMKMKRELIQTKDGSPTISVEGTRFSYHSHHGAITESKHIFINAGLRQLPKTETPIAIFEMGFGTGLNALLTFDTAAGIHHAIYYSAIELFPLEKEIWEQLSYPSLLHKPALEPVLSLMHSCSWGTDHRISDSFILHKQQQDLLQYQPNRKFNLIYFDAFAPEGQPELWTAEIFKKMYDMLEPGGLLLTYSSKGTVRRAMQTAGFTVEKIPGPPGKREITRATRPRIK